VRPKGDKSSLELVASDRPTERGSGEP